MIGRKNRLMKFYQILAKSQPNDYDKETIQAVELNLKELSNPNTQKIAVLFHHKINQYLLYQDNIYQCWRDNQTDLEPYSRTEFYTIRKLGPWIAPQIKSSVYSKIQEHFNQDNFALV